MTGHARRGLWWGTVDGAGVVELAEVAGAAGFSDISITPAMYFAERAGGRTDDELRSLIAATGATVGIIDPLARGLPGIPLPDDVHPKGRAPFEHGEDECFRIAEALGARVVNIAHWLGAPTPVEELVDAIGAISERAADRGLEIVVEFMPEGAIADLATTARIVAGVGSPNCGLMLDTWHLWRTGGTVAELAALPPGCIRAVQLSDALVDVRDTWRQPPTRDRLLPGDGDIPLVDIMRVVLDNYPDALIGLEVLSRPFRERPAPDRAHAAFAALSRLLDAAGSP